jgi:integrase
MYYARVFRDKKQIWKSLKTKAISVAQVRLAELLKIHRAAAKTIESVGSGKATVGQLATVYLEGEARRVDIKPATIEYRRRMWRSITKTWPELTAMNPRQISESMVREWAHRHSEEYSGTQYNNSVDTLHAIFESAVTSGAIVRNPVNRDEIGKRKPCQKKLELPTGGQFEAVVREVRGNGSLFAPMIGDTVEFLAYSGCRIEEAANVKWADVQDGRIWIHGDAETGTKGGDSRRIPIIPPLARLLEKIKTRPLWRKERGEYVLQIRECIRSLGSACEKVGVRRLTQHDLRHLFATRCIESGVDIPTVSRWLGHKDGGALAMRTYGHLRDEHSQAMAAKVQF